MDTILMINEKKKWIRIMLFFSIKVSHFSSFFLQIENKFNNLLFFYGIKKNKMQIFKRILVKLKPIFQIFDLRQSEDLFKNLQANLDKIFLTLIKFGDRLKKKLTFL